MPEPRQSASLIHIRPWWRRQWLSVRRDGYSRRFAARSIARDIVAGFRAKHIRRVP